MNIDRDDLPGQVPLAGFAAQRPSDAAAPRRDGIRHARRMSNWTLAALIAGTGAATVALVHQAAPAVQPAGTASTATGQQAGSSGGGPTVSHPVATTTGSGATVTTTTRTVHGRTVIIRTVHAPSDN